GIRISWPRPSACRLTSCRSQARNYRRRSPPSMPRPRTCWKKPGRRLPGNRIESARARRATVGEPKMSVATSTRTRFEVVPLTKHIGAELRGIDLRTKPDADTIRAIYQAWLDHLVIVFPGQQLSQEDLLRVTAYFGELSELSRPAKYFPKGYARLLPGIMLI